MVAHGAAAAPLAAVDVRLRGPRTGGGLRRAGGGGRGSAPPPAPVRRGAAGARRRARSAAARAAVGGPGGRPRVARVVLAASHRRRRRARPSRRCASAPAARARRARRCRSSTWARGCRAAAARRHVGARRHRPAGRPIPPPARPRPGSAPRPARAQRTPRPTTRGWRSPSSRRTGHGGARRRRGLADRRAAGLPAALRPRTRAAHAGQVLRVGPIRLRVLWPPAPCPAGAPRQPERRRARRPRRTARSTYCSRRTRSPPRSTSRGSRPLKVAHHGSVDDGLPAMLERTPRGSRRSRSAAQRLRAPGAVDGSAPCASCRALAADGHDGTVRLRVAGGHAPGGRAGDRPWRQLDSAAVPAFRPAYLIHGDDHGRITERRTRLRAMAEVETGPGGVELLEGDACTPDAVAAALCAMTFALGRRFVIADGVERWKEADVGGRGRRDEEHGRRDPDGRVLRPRGGPLQGPGRAAQGGRGGGRPGRRGGQRQGRDLPRWLVARAAELGVELDTQAARAP